MVASTLKKLEYMKEYRNRPEVKARILEHIRQPSVKKQHADYEANRGYRVGLHVPMEDAKDCASYLGVHVAEKVLSKFFNHIERMPYGNPGYDFLCGKGFKIDVKSRCRNKRLHHGVAWIFGVGRNKIPDHFLFLAFDTRENLNPEHVWLIPGNIVNDKLNVYISESKLSKWAKYEHPLDKVIACCNKMKEL